MLLNATIDALGQINTIVGLVKQQSPDMAKRLFVEQRIGTHIRHVYDHFNALQEGKRTGTVDYNQRSRNSKAETDIVISEAQHKQIVAALADGTHFSSTLKVISEIDCFKTENMEIPSNYARELLYLINHAIHHVAIIKLILEHNGVSVPSYIGLAPGTASYLRVLDQCVQVCAR
ncbi:hypothetical protein [Dasania marina]|uniref:hypothetical protein n=1 Tax=Dasania marina TaxID=471499 RepID=UPI0030D800E4|tara:strand:- start:83330 stop:83854 length:525 start_codon:yes stop_codon:yes gene_type:complete